MRLWHRPKIPVIVAPVPDPVIDVVSLSKRFGAVTAVDGVSFAIPAGAIVGLLGSNGAGKTTTLAMLLGLLLPTGGRIAVLGEDMLRHRHRVLPRMNFSSPYVDLPHRLTVRENLTVYAHLYGLPDTRRRVAQVAEDLAIADLLGRRTRGPPPPRGRPAPARGARAAGGGPPPLRPPGAAPRRPVARPEGARGARQGA